MNKVYLVMSKVRSGYSRVIDVFSKKELAENYIFERDYTEKIEDYDDEWSIATYTDEGHTGKIDIDQIRYYRPHHNDFMYIQEFEVKGD